MTQNNKDLPILKNEKKETITLKGTAITESGKLSKSDFFNFLSIDLDDYSDVEFTPQEARKVSNHLRKLSTGSCAMTPMYCAGPECPFADRCPLQAIDKAPVGKQCLIEVQLMKEWIVRYFEEYNVDPNNFTEVAYINELAEIEILLMRLNMSLAKKENAELVIDQVTALAHDGTPILQKQLSPFMEQKEKLQNRRSKIIKLMVGDRQEKYKKEAALKVKEDKDPSSIQAAMRKKLEALQRKINEVEGDTTKKAIEGNKNRKETISPQDLIDSIED